MSPQSYRVVTMRLRKVVSGQTHLTVASYQRSSECFAIHLLSGAM